MIRAISAFANDLSPQGGGYVVIGIAGEGGHLALPPRGLPRDRLARIEDEIRTACNRIDPVYQPMVSQADYQGRAVLILFAPPGEAQPYRAPKRGDPAALAYHVREGASTGEASEGTLTHLLAHARRIPFDDRRNLEARVEAISPTLVRKYLHDVRSDLLNSPLDDREIYRRTGLVSPVNGHEVPRNVALLFFCEEPERFFRGAVIEIAEFGESEAGDVIGERRMTGPLPSQIHAALGYLRSTIQTTIRKVPGRAGAEHSTSYPYEAIEEALVNAVYHRSYERSEVEPTKVRLFPDRMEFVSYPGPVPGISREALSAETGIPSPPARNRRIGDFLKALRLTEAHGKGLAKIRRRMRQNGSPPPLFDFDDSRTWFRTTLPKKLP